MTFVGVPILDWVLLVVLIGFGVEAYITTRHKDDGDKAADRGADDPEAAASSPTKQTQDDSEV